jgi:hypothetical protein
MLLVARHLPCGFDTVVSAGRAAKTAFDPVAKAFGRLQVADARSAEAWKIQLNRKLSWFAVARAAHEKAAGSLFDPEPSLGIILLGFGNSGFSAQPIISL